MALPLKILRLLSCTLGFICYPAVSGESTLESRVDQAAKLLAEAEDRFELPAEHWFHSTQQALREEVAQVELVLASMEASEQAAWREHLRWRLLEENLQSREARYEELAIVRRWLYSNREGLEGPVFAELRTKMDAHLDAAYTFEQANLQSAFEEKVALAREELRAIAAEPTDERAVDLARTLGWFEQTGQLTEEVAAIRSLLSQPNAQLAVSDDLARRLLQIFDTEIDQDFPIKDTNQAPPSGIRRKGRTLQVRGTANTVGSTELEIVANEVNAEVRLVFKGKVLACCKADAGPAQLHVMTSGPVQASKPLLFSTTGWTLGETKIETPVNTRLRKVTADRQVVQGIARRQAKRPVAQSHMRSTAKAHTAKMLTENMDRQVNEAVAEIRAEIKNTQQSISGFSDVLAPLSREGAVPTLAGFCSDPRQIKANVITSRRDQFGALTPCPEDLVGGDVQVRVHLSFFNNSLETILGGKTLSDEFLMRYAKILQPQLPLPLMVHARSTRWAVTTEKYRPLEISLPSPDKLLFTMRITAVDIGGERFETAATARTTYKLLKNDFDEYELVRDGEVELDTPLPTDAQQFLSEKLDAFFAPLLNAGGVAVPDGGFLGAFNKIELAGLKTSDNWLVLGLNIPQTVFDAVAEYQRSQKPAGDIEL
ncbi:MAG: hypothetical protein KDA57_02530 [Planctomycetales bacterium]|nr:hypothetical protein [Planctomycetales bacterium]